MTYMNTPYLSYEDCKYELLEKGREEVDIAIVYDIKNPEETMPIYARKVDNKVCIFFSTDSFEVLERINRVFGDRDIIINEKIDYEKAIILLILFYKLREKDEDNDEIID